MLPTWLIASTTTCGPIVATSATTWLGAVAADMASLATPIARHLRLCRSQYHGRRPTVLVVPKLRNILVAHRSATTTTTLLKPSTTTKTTWLKTKTTRLKTTTWLHTKTTLPTKFWAIATTLLPCGSARWPTKGHNSLVGALRQYYHILQRTWTLEEHLHTYLLF